MLHDRKVWWSWHWLGLKDRWPKPITREKRPELGTWLPNHHEEISLPWEAPGTRKKESAHQGAGAKWNGLRSQDGAHLVTFMAYRLHELEDKTQELKVRNSLYILLGYRPFSHKDWYSQPSLRQSWVNYIQELWWLQGRVPGVCRTLGEPPGKFRSFSWKLRHSPEVWGSPRYF